VFREGQRTACPLFTLLYRRTATDRTRLGVIAGKKLGGAVQRNRCKRRFRELMRIHHNRLTPGWDVLLIAKREAIAAPAANLRLAWTRTLARAGLFLD
jgi:ribonuclease P protein component